MAIFDDIETLDDGKFSDNKMISENILLTGKMVGLENSTGITDLQQITNGLYGNEYSNMRDSINKIRQLSLIIKINDTKPIFFQMLKSMSSIDGDNLTYGYLNSKLDDSKKINPVEIIACKLSSDFSDVYEILDDNMIKSLESIIKLNPNSIEEKMVVYVDKLKTLAKYYVLNKGWNMEMVENFINRQLLNICLSYSKTGVFDFPSELSSDFELATKELDLTEEEKKILDDLVIKYNSFDNKNDIINDLTSFNFSSSRKRD